MLLIKNGKVLSMEGTDYENGYVLLNEGKIVRLGGMDDFSNEVSNADKVIDAGGGYILPGFIDAHCHVGMWEDSIGFEGDDGNEDTDPVTPHLRAIDAINPNDRAFQEAREAGVTTVVTGPGSANVIGGQFAAIKTYGRRIDEMILKEPVAMKVALGENPKTVYHQKNQSPTTRMATAAILRENLLKANEYKTLIDEHHADPEEIDKPDFDFKMESLLKVLDKQIPVKVHAHRADDMFTALRIAKEFDLNITLEHCTEGHLIVDYLKEEKVPLMVGPSLSDRSKPELKNLTFKTPGILAQEGLSVAIITDHPVTPIQYLPLCAALAVREGMNEKDALKAITINAANNCGIGNRVGSIKEGKDGDIIIFDGHPLDFRSRPEYVIIDGKVVFERTK
ncbi:amidohydrolase [Petroclostridium sp. X23]|uniref:amidohydrolase n=1 Tax=Petroclostridium sp. X23 TaxID=3045146 RepID=UPI0024AC9FB1|nr:amidohydrolase [Petroclostridium sp. X23]WHH56898.1 amidohydrolase [Petroclostridium sp. X23]